MGKNLIADLRASLTWDLDDFERGTRQIDSGFGRLIDRARQMADDFASVGKRMTQALTVPIAGMGAAFTARAVMMANDAKAIKVAATTAAEGVESFQKRAFAAEREAGIAMEKFADISKDTLDKVGDYFATGGGELAEFFEDVAPRVGVTAEMFRGLSGPDALQLFYNTLDRANVSQQEMVFFLESIADEGSLLIPLLADNGRLFEELGEKANIFTAEEIEKWVRMKDALGDLGIAFDRLFLAIADTGLIDWLTRAIEKGAEFIDRFSKANPMLFKMAVYLLAAGAAAGPVLMVLTALASFILPLFLAGLGPIGLAISALINPFLTLVIVAGNFLEIVGARLLPLLGRLVVGFLGLTGPIGAVIAVFLLFFDRVIDGLQNVWRIAQETLGPNFARMLEAVRDATERVSAAFAEFTQSPIGQFLAVVIDLVGDLVEVLVTLSGSAVVGAFNVLLSLITALIEWISGMVEITANLLSGDWAGAWQAAGDMVGRVIDSLFPLFQNLWSWIEATLVKLGLMEARAVQANAAARGETPGQSRTLSGKVITDEQLMGLGDVPQPREPWRRTPEVSTPKVKRGGGRTGPSAKELADRRAMLELEHDIAVARERGDQGALRALERERDLRRNIEQYERAGLSNAQARTAAEKDMLELDQARAVARERELRDFEDSFDIQLARLREDHAHLQTLEDQEFVRDRIDQLERIGLSRAEAEQEAAKDLLALEEARAEQLERRLAAQRAAHSIELAQIKGDFALADRLREDERIAGRIRELQQDDPSLTFADAQATALQEAADRSRAYLQGSFRDAFRGGLRAAMDNNFWNWFKDRLSDSSFNALAKVLDKLADNLVDMLFDAKGGNGGGLLGAIGGFLTSIFGSGGGSGPTNLLAGTPYETPGFNTGGSFKVRGFAGIDRNILSLNGSPVARVSQNEIVDVRRGEPAGSATHVGVDVRLLGFNEMFDMQVDRRIGQAAGGIAAAGAAGGAARIRAEQEASFE